MLFLSGKKDCYISLHHFTKTASRENIRFLALKDLLQFQDC